jgi:hypothetical protein
MMIATGVGMYLDMTNTGNYEEFLQTSDYLSLARDEYAKFQNATIDCTSWPMGPSCPTPAPGPSPDTQDNTPVSGRYPNFMGPLDLMDQEDLFNEINDRVLHNFTDPTRSDGPFAGVISWLQKYPSDATMTRVAGNLKTLFDVLCTDPATTTITASITDDVCFFYSDDGTGHCSFPIDPATAMTWWSNTASQSVITTAIADLENVPTARIPVARLKILNKVQQATGQYINSLIQANASPAPSPGSALPTFVPVDPFQSFLDSFDAQNFPDNLFEDLQDAELDDICVTNGGVIINPGPGWNSHTCTWATKEDCHGAFPLEPSDITPNTENLMCMMTTPAPCPAYPAPAGCTPAGSPSIYPAPSWQAGDDCCGGDGVDTNNKCLPQHCPPPITYRAPSPCPAVQCLINGGCPVPCPAGTPADQCPPPLYDLNLTYTEWRNKDWFSSPGSTWAPLLDQNQIPSGGACVQADPAIQQECAVVHSTGLGVTQTAVNKYDRVHGVCVNSSEYCQIKGVKYGDVTLSEMGIPNPSQGDVVRLGATPVTSAVTHWHVGSTIENSIVDIATGNFGDVGNQQIAEHRTGPGLKSCYRDDGQIVAETLFTDSLVRWFASGGFAQDFRYGINYVFTQLGPQLQAWDNQFQAIRPQYIHGVPVAYPPPIQPVSLTQPPSLHVTPLAPPPNINNITIVPPPTVGGLNGVVGAGITAATTLANTGIYLANGAEQTGVMIANNVQQAGVNLANDVQAAGVSATNTVLHGAIDVANDVQAAGITAVNTLENAGIAAVNALEQASLEAAKASVNALTQGAISVLGAVKSGTLTALTNGQTGQAGAANAQSGGNLNPSNWGSGSCFPGNSRVLLDTGDYVSMFDLKNGMKILAVNGKGEPVFSEVFTWIVRDSDLEDVFLELETESGKSARLSKQHYIHVTQGTWKDTFLISAQEVQVGQYIWVDFKPSKVVSIRVITEKGVFSPVTLEGSIVVDSVTASCVTTYEDILGSKFPTLYITKRTPPMMVHHFIMKWMYHLGGQSIMDSIHKPLYALAGISPPK